LQEGQDSGYGRNTQLIDDNRETSCCETMTNETTRATIDTLPILIAPHPILKARARPVRPDDVDLVRQLIPRMFATMYRAPGIGLAAPQISHSLRLVVIDLLPNDKKQPYCLINPEVVAASETRATREEGCLSLPGQYADIARPAWVRVRYLDEAGAKLEIEVDGLLAACVQHEIDHLDGVLFVDHLSALKRNMIMRRLAKDQRLKHDEGPR
jgi:peptide deformylase